MYAAPFGTTFLTAHDWAGHASAAVKANRRRWDPPKKTDPAVVQDSEISTAAESESVAHREPDFPLRRVTSKPKKMPSVQQETRNGVALRPRSTADAASGADDSSGEEFYDESRDADYLPGERYVSFSMMEDTVQ